MPLLVNSAAGVNGNGYGTPLAFDPDGKPLGAFCDDSRIADPRGLGVDRAAGLLFVNSGADRILALDRDGKVVRDTGPIEGLNPGGGNFGPDGRYYVGSRNARTIMAFATGLDAVGEHVLPPEVVPFPRGFAFGRRVQEATRPQIQTGRASLLCCPGRSRHFRFHDGQMPRDGRHHAWSEWSGADVLPLRLHHRGV